jgi:hypothetical protein
VQDNEIKILDKVLYGDLQPWLPSMGYENSFTSLLDKYSSPEIDFQPHFEIKFQSPFNAKTIYFNKLIRDQTLYSSHYLIELISSSQPKALKIYWLTSTIDKLKTRFSDLANVIKTNDFSITYIDPRKTTFDQDQRHKSDVYIMQLLKLAYMQLYLEIQNTFSGDLTDHLTEADIYMRFLFETLPETQYIEKLKNIDIQPLEKANIEKAQPLVSKTPKKISPDEYGFKPIKSDLPNNRSSTVSYKELILNPDLFAEVEERLYEYEVIDNEYTFIKNKKNSNSTNLAAIVKTMIERNYFRRNILGSRKKYTDTHIREFIENRYQADIKQQFRRITTTQIEAVLLKHPWLEKIQPLR